MNIEDVLRRYAPTQNQFYEMLKKDLVYFSGLCDGCVDSCNKKYHKPRCFENYLTELGYKPIERRQKDVHVAYERRKEEKKGKKK